MDEAVLKLADRLGIAANELIGFYVQRIPALWVDVALSGIMALAFTVMALIGFRSKKTRNDYGDWPEWRVAFVVIGSMGGFVALILLSVSISEAVHATIAPKAYAVDQILRSF